MNGWSRLKVVWAALCALACSLALLSAYGIPGTPAWFFAITVVAFLYIGWLPASDYWMSSRVIAGITAAIAYVNLASFVVGIEPRGALFAGLSLAAGAAAVGAAHVVAWVGRGFSQQRSS